MRLFESDLSLASEDRLALVRFIRDSLEERRDAFFVRW